MAYVKGTYQLSEHWQQQELSRDMRIFVWYADENIPLVGQLREYFNRVTIISNLGIENIVDVYCY